jgi:hypothetical protein
MMSDDAKKPEQEPVFDSVDPVRRRLMMGAAALGGASATGMLGA